MVKIQLSQTQIILIVLAVIAVYFLVQRCHFYCSGGISGIEGLIRTDLPSGNCGPGMVQCGQECCTPEQCEFTLGVGNIDPPMYMYCTN